MYGMGRNGKKKNFISVCRGMMQRTGRLTLCYFSFSVFQGKSLSLLCASLTWLRDHKAKTFDVNLQDGEEGKFQDVVLTTSEIRSLKIL